MRRKGRAVIIAVSLMGTALFFLPSLLGLQPVIRALLDLADRHLPGTLEVESCSLGWVQGVRCEQVRYHDPVHGLRLEGPRLASDKGLFLLLAAPAYLGEITIDQPTLSFLPPQPDRGTPHNQPVTSVGGEAGFEASNRDAPEKVPWWEHLSFRLKVNNGGLVLEQAATPGQKLGREIDLLASFAMGTVNYDLHFRSALQEGHLRAKGFINLPLAGQSVLETLVSRSEVEVKDLELADFLDLAASRSNMPRGKGVLNANFHLNVAGMKDLEVGGDTFLRGIQLTGGVLGDDHPLLDQLYFTFKGSHRTGEGWRLSALDLQSEPIRLTAVGSFDGKMVSLSAKGSVKLPVVATQLPRLLALHEKTTITEGAADFSFEATGSPEALAMRANCRTDRLGFVHDARNYSWDTPLDLLAEVDYGREKMAFRTLRLHTPFFEVQGSGGIDDFTLRAGGDLDQMFQELKKLFALNVHAKGRAELSASSRKQEDGGYGMESRISIQGFAFSRGKVSLFPAHDFLLTGKIGAAPSFVRDGALRSLQVDGTFWPGNFSLWAEDMQRSPEQTQNNCTLKGAVDLARVGVFMHGFGDGGPSSVFGGNLKFDGAGEWEGRQVSLQRFTGTIERLAVSGMGYALQQPLVTFGMGVAGRPNGRSVAVRELMVAENWQNFSDQEQAKFLVDFDRQRLEVRHLGVTSATSSLDGECVIEEWLQPAAGFSAALKGATDGALLADLVKAAGWFPPDLAVKGRAQIALATASWKGQGERTDLTLRMEPFELLRGKKKLFADPRPNLGLSLHSEGKEKGEVKIPSFFLRTAPLNIEGAGVVARNDLPSLELQGQITPDFAILAPLLAPIFGREAVVAGNQAGEFLLSLPLALPLNMEQLTFTAQLPVDSFRFLGIGLRQLILPVDLNRGKLRVGIDGKLGSGQVALHPWWDLAASQMLMSLPPATQLLKDVPIKPPLVDGLLGRLHALFGALAQPQGTVDLRVDSFSLPVTEKGQQQPAFTATIALDRVKFRATDVLRKMLDQDGFDQEWLSCKERELVCEGKNGRVSCAPVHLMGGSAEIGLRGHMDFNGALHYRVRLPVGKKLADSVQLVVQANATAEAEIGGTRAEPVFDQSAFLAGLPGQLSKDIVLTEHKTEAESQPAPASEKPVPAASQP